MGSQKDFSFWDLDGQKTRPPIRVRSREKTRAGNSAYQKLDSIGGHFNHQSGGYNDVKSLNDTSNIDDGKIGTKFNRTLENMHNNTLRHIEFVSDHQFMSSRSDDISHDGIFILLIAFISISVLGLFAFFIVFANAGDTNKAVSSAMMMRNNTTGDEKMFYMVDAEGMDGQGAKIKSRNDGDVYVTEETPYVVVLKKRRPHSFPPLISICYDPGIMHRGNPRTLLVTANNVDLYLYKGALLGRCPEGKRNTSFVTDQEYESHIGRLNTFQNWRMYMDKNGDWDSVIKDTIFACHRDMIVTCNTTEKTTVCTDSTIFNDRIRMHDLKIGVCHETDRQIQRWVAMQNTPNARSRRSYASASTRNILPKSLYE